MADYIDIEQAKPLDGLRIVAPPGRPNPWAEGLKGMCHIKNLPYVLVGKAPGHDAALQDWTSQSSSPVAVWNEERPRTTWNEQLYLVDAILANLFDLLELALHGKNVLDERQSGDRMHVGFFWITNAAQLKQRLLGAFLVVVAQAQ